VGILRLEERTVDVLALSDGVTRPADQMKIYDWSQYPDLAFKLGATGIIEHVRVIENDDPDGDRYSRTKCHDDAAVAVWAREVN
jgi:hypothetical protein